MAAAAAVCILKVPTAICHLDNSQLEAVYRRVLLLLLLLLLLLNRNCSAAAAIQSLCAVVHCAAAKQQRLKVAPVQMPPGVHLHIPQHKHQCSASIWSHAVDANSYSRLLRVVKIQR
jgi:hypothetical protein